jgi:hypothetical protein
MILYDDLHYLIGLFLIIYIFYYDFFVNRHRFLIKYEDRDYLEYERTSLRAKSHLTDEEIDAFLRERVRCKNRYHVYNMVFFLVFVGGFLLLVKMLVHRP